MLYKMKNHESLYYGDNLYPELGLNECSVQVVEWLHGLAPETMLCKELLGRLGNPLNEAEERRKAKRTRRRRRSLDNIYHSLRIRLWIAKAMMKRKKSK